MNRNLVFTLYFYCSGFYRPTLLNLFANNWEASSSTNRNVTVVLLLSSLYSQQSWEQYVSGICAYAEGLLDRISLCANVKLLNFILSTRLFITEPIVSQIASEKDLIFIKSTLYTLIFINGNTVAYNMTKIRRKFILTEVEQIHESFN